MPTLDEFLAFVESRKGPPPARPVGVRSWGDLAKKLRGVPAEDLEATLRTVEQTFVVDVGGEDYERWSVDKRAAANRDAAKALREAQARGEASLEQKNRMFAYTGFGGFGGTEIGVLPPEYPDEYVAASKAWVEASRTGGAVPAAQAQIMERVRDQYFTSLEVCRALWVLVQRTNPDAKTAMEPSVGIGRMIQTAPAGLRWLAAEFDTMMAAMVALCFPGATVNAGPFERYAAAHSEDRFDVIVGNPPYAKKRPPEFGRIDLPEIGDAVNYFTLRCASMLAPGGTLAFVVPFSFMTSANRVEVRTRMLRGCAFRGAAVLPSGAFPGVRDGTFVIMLWTRRAANITDAQFDAREKVIASGGYLTLPEAEQALCGGEWKTSSFGESRGSFLHGKPDLSRIGQLFLTPAPSSVVRAVEEADDPAEPVPVLWREPVPGTKASEVTQIIYQQTRKGPIVHAHLSSWFPGLAVKPEVRYIDETTLQFVWKSRRTWAGVQIHYNENADTYELVRAMGSPTATIADDEALTDVYGEDLSEVDVLFPAHFLGGWWPAKAPIDHLHDSSGDLAKVVGLIVKDLRGPAYEALAEGGGVVVRSGPAYQELVIQWVHAPHPLVSSTPTAALAVYHRRDDGVPDIYALLAVDQKSGLVIAPPEYVFAGSNPVSGPDRELTKVWAQNLLSQGYRQGAASAVPIRRNEDGEGLDGALVPGAERPVPPQVRPQAPTAPVEVAAEQDAETVLATRVRAFLRLVANDPNAAEGQREAVRQEVLLHIADHGNPHPKGPAALRAVVSKTGTLEPVLSEPVKAARYVSGSPPEGTFEEIVSWWSERKGYATHVDLQITDQEAIDLAIQSPDVMVELRPEGPVVYAEWAYMTGSPAARMEPIDAALAGELHSALRRKLEGQKTKVLAQWAGAKTLGEIDATPRSPFVPVEALQEWINVLIRPEYWRKAESRPLPEHWGPDITLAVADSLMSVALDDPGLKFATNRKWDIDPLYWLLGYYNRSSMVEDLEGTGKNTNVYGQSDARDRARLDADMIGKFLDWLGESSWVPTIETEYNTKFAPPLLSSVPSTPIELAGQSPTYRLHPHQNQAVRRASLGGQARSALIAYDVGAGKTTVGIATAMRWYQTGACRRVVIAVPVSVLAKWYADAVRVFPDARIGVIGMTPGRAGSDNAQTRIEKWLRFAAGAYDLCIVGHSTLFLDLEPDEEEVAELLGGIMWARKDAGEQVADIKRLKLRLENARKLLAALKAATDWHSYSRLFERFSGGWGVHRDKKVIETQAEVDKYEAELQSHGPLGTDSEVAVVQQVLRDLASRKPYRPSHRIAVDASPEDMELEFDESAGATDGGEDEDGKKKAKPGGVEIRKAPSPGLLRWSDLGIDGLIVDEAHRYKNLWFPQDAIEYAGKGSDEMFGAPTPWDMLIKTGLVHKKHGGSGGVMFLTATPMTNSPLELYSLLSMIAPTMFEDAGIYDKEQFIDRYWQTEVRDVVTASGVMKPARALTGFKNLNELLGMIGGIFDKKSTAELVAAGWIKDQPTVTVKEERFDRDSAQTALVRTLVAVRSAWMQTEEEAKQEDRLLAAGMLSRTTSGCGATGGTTYIDKTKWTIDPDGHVRAVGRAHRDGAPEILKDRETAFRARGIFQVVWMGLLDKIAIDPRLILDYVERVHTRFTEMRQKAEVFEQWAEDRAAGRPHQKKPPPRPKESDYITMELAVALFDQMPLAEVAEFYRTRPIVPKVEAVAQFIRDNLLRPKGRCGHVVFVDWVELHEQVRDAIVAATADLGADRITKDRIAFITGDIKPPKRLEISKKFNGRDEVRVKGVVVEEATAPTYDVVIGTTGAMAEGMDLQRRSCAVHHLNLGWKPAELHQRNGRAVRQGNLMGSVDVVYYLTERTFDGMRFDKIARKAAWWDQMFSGQSSTSNPAIAEDAGRDLDEVILSLVVEDPEELRECVTAIRAVREAKLRSERIEDAATDWLHLNAAFAQARAAVDPQRREALFQNAMRRRDAWKIKHTEFIVEGSLEALNDTAVAIEWDLGRVVRSGETFQWRSEREQIKVLEVLVRPRGFLALTRIKGHSYSSTHALEDLFGKVRTNGWTFREEHDQLIRSLTADLYLWRHLADIPPDLMEHAHSLSMGAIKEVATRMSGRGRVYATMSSPLFVLKDGTGEGSRVLVTYPVGWDKPVGGRNEESLRAELLLESLLQDPPAQILPERHPDAWSTWVRAFRSDRILTPTLTAPTGYAASLGLPRVARASKNEWQAYTRALFGRALPADALAQRFKLTGEPDSTKKVAGSS